MIELCRDYVHDPAGTGRTIPEWERLLTRGQAKLIEDAPLDETTTTLTILGGSDSVALPADFLSSSIPGVVAPHVILRQDARRNFAETALKRPAAPLFFCIFGRTLEIETRVENDLALEVTYARMPPPIVAASTPAYDPEFHHHMPHYAAGLALMSDRAPTEATFHLGEAAEIRRRASRAYEARHIARRRRGEIGASRTGGNA